MKRSICCLLLVMIAAASCKKDNDSTGIQPVDVVVRLDYDLDSSKYAFPLKGVTVKITNSNLGTSQSAVAADSGIIHFNGVPAGEYTIEANITIAAADYSTITGLLQTEDVTFNASDKKTLLIGSVNTIDLNLVAGKVSDWVIKQVYYAGSNTTNGAIFRDQFIELYNNSDKVLYADSMYIAQVWGKQNFTGSTYYVQSNGQLDWSKSVDMPAGVNANSNYLYTRSILMLPGTGKTYPVQPGSSVVIAQTALNHKTPFVGSDGEAISVKNPDLTVDLSGADFEAYYASFISNPYPSDIDNPNVPNVEVIQYYGRDYILDNPGRDAYIIFKVDGSQQVSNWPQYYQPTVATPTSSATKYYQVPVQYVLDAVEVQPSTVSSRVPKKLNAQLDAGFTFAPLGAYSSQSVIRKTAKTVNGRIVLKDTNNSTEDFDYLPVAAPRGFK